MCAWSLGCFHVTLVIGRMSPMLREPALIYHLAVTRETLGYLREGDAVTCIYILWDGKADELVHQDGRDGSD